MLILARKKDQSICIGDDIVVTVVEIQGDQVRLGVTAPRTVMVLRGELFEAVREANTKAVQAAQQSAALAVLEQLKNFKTRGKKEEK